MKKILIIGSINDSHLIRLVKHIKQYDQYNQLKFDGLNFKQEKDNLNHNICCYYYTKNHFNKFFYRIPLIRKICNNLDIIISFIQIKEKYDIYNFHYPTIYTSLLRHFVKKGSQIIITPWGSDVYRINNNEYKYIKKLYEKADYVTVSPLKFKLDIKNKFNVPENKFINLGFGSEIIDELLSTQLNNERAKIEIGYANKYIITCGYNGNPNQNHIQIIKALTAIKETLPKNIVLLFPITYGIYDNEYIIKLKEELLKSGFEYFIYDSYLDNKTITNIRLATDLFIHIQSSDAYSATVQEFLLTDTVVFNGSWLRYPNLETNGIPYHLVDDISKLESSLSYYFKYKENISISQECKEIIKKRSWKEKGKEWYEHLIKNNNRL